MKNPESVAKEHESAAGAVKPNPGQAQYIWGYSDEEFKRLEAQGIFLAPMTRKFLADIGISAGLRVLDAGCGTGDVSFLAAELAGPSGEVVGIDRAESPLTAAAARARAKGLTNVRFVRCDIDEVAELAATEGLFDAVVGRNVLIHHPRPTEAVLSLMRAVRPGGVAGFQEADLDVSYWSTQELAAMDLIHDHLQKFAKSGVLGSNLTSKFSRAFAEAGATERRITRSADIGETSEGAIEWVGGLARMLAAAAPSAGLSPPEYDPKSIESLLKSEVTSKDASFCPLYWISATARVAHVGAADS